MNDTELSWLVGLFEGETRTPITQIAIVAGCMEKMPEDLCTKFYP